MSFSEAQLRDQWRPRTLAWDLVSSLLECREKLAVDGISFQEVVPGTRID